MSASELVSAWARASVSDSVSVSVSDSESGWESASVVAVGVGTGVGVDVLPATTVTVTLAESIHWSRAALSLAVERMTYTPVSLKVKVVLFTESLPLPRRDPAQGSAVSQPCQLQSPLGFRISSQCSKRSPSGSSARPVTVRLVPALTS